MPVYPPIFNGYFLECLECFFSLRHEKNLTTNSFELHLFFDAFIQSRNKNSKTNRITRVRNHLILFKLILEFQQVRGQSILIHPYQGRDERMIRKIRASYKNDITALLDFFYNTKGHFDNTVNTHTKNLKIYLRWLENNKGFHILRYCSDFMVKAQPIPIIVLSEE